MLMRSADQLIVLPFNCWCMSALCTLPRLQAFSTTFIDSIPCAPSETAVAALEGLELAVVVRDSYQFLLANRVEAG